MVSNKPQFGAISPLTTLLNYVDGQDAIRDGAIIPADHGALGWTCDPQTTGTFAPTTGSVYGTVFRAGSTGICGNIKMQCTTLSTTATSLFVGLFDMSGNQLGISATAHVAFQTTGAKTVALLTPVSLIAGTTYVYGFLSVGGTAPTIVSSVGASSPSLGMTVGTSAPLRQMKTSSTARTAFTNPEVWTGYAVVGNSPLALMTV
jgi:hypothetical protein